MAEKTVETMPVEKSFTELLQASSSDKFSRHHYERWYTGWFAPFRHQHNMKVLEIGAQLCLSLRLWLSNFDNAELILGLAYEPETLGLDERLQSLGDRLRLYFGDQSKKETIQY